MVELHLKKYKNMEEVFEANKKVCNTIKKIRKENNISSRCNPKTIYAKLWIKYKKGKATEKEFRRFIARYLSYQYLQGLIHSEFKYKGVLKDGK